MGFRLLVLMILALAAAGLRYASPEPTHINIKVTDNRYEDYWNKDKDPFSRLQTIEVDPYARRTR